MDKEKIQSKKLNYPMIVAPNLTNEDIVKINNAQEKKGIINIADGIQIIMHNQAVLSEAIAKISKAKSVDAH